MKTSIGIDAISFSVPRTYLAASDLAVARGVAPEKYEKGLGVSRMAVPAPHEDAVTLAANAARRVMRLGDVDRQSIGMCAVGTETAVDHSKPIASYVHGLVGLPAQCRVFETKHACFGATASLMAAVEWIASGAARGRSALVVATDIARYDLGSPGEPTQGAGAVAMVISERPRLLEIEVGKTGSYARDVHDFWRPLHRKEALVDGAFSVQCYLDALSGAYDDWLGVVTDDAELERTCYHVPYGKMAQKAHRRRLAAHGMSDAEADARFAKEVAPSLIYPAEVGNVYSASLYLAFSSLLAAEAAQLEGSRVGLFSYGSGCGAELFAGRIARGAGAFVKQLDLGAPLVDRQRLGIPEYEALRSAEVRAEVPLAASGPSLDHDVVFVGTDEAERRIYGNAARSVIARAA